MSCFLGQMQEYKSIAIDKFDGKNLQCTAFFLSHCHKDHMVGLNHPCFAESLNSRNGVFLYCSEITRMLLLAEKDYGHLNNYIHVLKVGLPQPVRISSNSMLKEDYYVNVTPISAGHCPGSVMFLFEGHEGTCLYTGDFRWEINHTASIGAFKHENRLKEIKSMYVDTTFCIPGAYHIPKRSECVGAALTLVSDWLQQSSLHVVLISCPAKYGYEHLLMELSKRLNIKIHVPEWKVKIYDQIPELRNVFTCDPDQARVHACSPKVGHSHFLPCQTTGAEGKKFCVLRLRPSAMWFTSEKVRSETDDLVVAPESSGGLYRVCYSMHSSYSEIRDLVSYLQPEHAYPNVVPVSDTSLKNVMARLNSFLKHPSKLRITPAYFQPLGGLRNVLVQRKIQLESYDEPVFSSPETDTSKRIKKKWISSGQLTPQAGLRKFIINDNTRFDKGLTVNEPCNSFTSASHSSFKISLISSEKMQLFSNDGDDDESTFLTSFIEQQKFGKTEAMINNAELDTEDERYRQGKLSEGCSNTQKMKEVFHREVNGVKLSSSNNEVVKTATECAENVSNSDFTCAHTCYENNCNDQNADSDNGDEIVFSSQVSTTENKFHICKNIISKKAQIFQKQVNLNGSVLSSSKISVTEESDTHNSAWPDIKEAVTILSSSSESSQGTDEEESQIFWSANDFSKVNNYITEKSSGQMSNDILTVKDNNVGFAGKKFGISNDFDDCNVKESLSLTQAEKKIFDATPEQLKVKSRVKKSHSSLKKKLSFLPCVSILNSDDSCSMKKFRKEICENELAEISARGRCVMGSDIPVYSRQQTCYVNETAETGRHLAKVCNKYPPEHFYLLKSDLFHCKHNLCQHDSVASCLEMKQNECKEYVTANSNFAIKLDNCESQDNPQTQAGRSFKENINQNVVTSQKPVWIDLTNDNIIDLTSDNSE